MVTMKTLRNVVNVGDNEVIIVKKISHNENDNKSDNISNFGESSTKSFENSEKDVSCYNNNNVMVLTNGCNNDYDY